MQKVLSKVDSNGWYISTEKAGQDELAARLQRRQNRIATKGLDFSTDNWAEGKQVAIHLPLQKLGKPSAV